MREQTDWPAHASYMNGLAENGSIILGGPLGVEEQTFLLIFDAPNEEAIREQLEADPWSTDMLRITSIRPWEIVLDGNE